MTDAEKLAAFASDFLVGRQSLYDNIIKQFGGVECFMHNYKKVLAAKPNNELCNFTDEAALLEFYNTNSHELKKMVEELAVFMCFESLSDYIYHHIGKDGFSKDDVSEALNATENTDNRIAVATFLTYEGFEGMSAYFDYFEIESSGGGNDNDYDDDFELLD